MNLMNKPPAGLKQPKAKPDPEYLRKVRGEYCCCCGCPPPSEAHHCRDLPDHDERGAYDRLPGAAMKSADRDAIPLCRDCHWLFHNRRAEFHQLYGKDYGFIPLTRSMLDEGEIGF